MDSIKPDMNNIKVVIPARYHSARLPGKPLLDIQGKPMIIRVLEQVQQGLAGVPTYVATDDERILNRVKQSGFEALMTHANHSSGTDRVYQVAEMLGWSADTIIINVQGDEPLIEPRLLSQFRAFCQQQQDFAMASVMTSIEPEQCHNPDLVKVVVNQADKALYFSRAAIPHIRDETDVANKPQGFYGHIGIYAYSVATLKTLCQSPMAWLEQMEKLEQLRALFVGIDIPMFSWQGTHYGGVDTPADLTRVIQHWQAP